LRNPYYGDVITFSHFLPRRSLPWSHIVPGLAQAVGCRELDTQLRKCGSRFHVYGHSHIDHSTVEDGVRYLQRSIGYTGEHGDKDPLWLIHDGKECRCDAVPSAGSGCATCPSGWTRQPSQCVCCTPSL
jgi:hypothetical protein